MIVDLDVSLNNSSTEMYQRAGKIPSRLHYDNKYSSPYLADQQIIVPVTDTAVRDYILVQPAYVPPVYDPLDPDNDRLDPVDYSVLATSAEFSIHSVHPNNGSSFGSTTISITGFDFDTTTQFILINGTDTIFPVTTGLYKTSTAMVLYDLRDHTIGKYTLKAIKPGATATLPEGFEVTETGFADPWVNIDATSVELIRNKTALKMNYGNYGNSDGFDYWLVLAITNTAGDLDALNTTYVGSAQEEINEYFEFTGNPTGDSTHIDINGIRYFIYWIPRLPSKSQNTFTYQMNHSEEDTTFCYAVLFRQPMSAYTLSGNPSDLSLSTTLYELHEALSDNAGPKQSRWRTLRSRRPQLRCRTDRSLHSGYP